jgi:hypothetical protein
MMKMINKYGAEEFSFWPQGFALENMTEFGQLLEVYNQADPENPPICIQKIDLKDLVDAHILTETGVISKCYLCHLPSTWLTSRHHQKA